MRGRPCRRHFLALELAGLLTLALPLGSAHSAAPPPSSQHLAFEVEEGRNLNAFLREGPVAAHMLLRSGHDPRILVAFPAGNSGVGLWFDRLNQPVHWHLVDPPRVQNTVDGHGRPLRGIVAEVELDAPRLTVHKAILSSVRVLRDYQSAAIDTPEVEVAPRAEASRLIWQRDRLDGAAGYRLAVIVTRGVLQDGEIVAANGAIRMRIEAQTGEAPLTPIDGSDLLNHQAAADPAATHTLSFLSYHDKFLAGSWRFNTYFGRDTMMSMGLLMPALQAGAIEDGLRSVIARLSPTGEAAHEEGIGEFAVLDHMRHHDGQGDAPEYDYGMIDSTFMLAPLAARYLIDDPAGASRARTFLASPSGKVGDGEEVTGVAIMRNFRLVLAQTFPFFKRQVFANLLSIKPGRTTGEWRDSNIGLGYGRYPYDVNAVLAPAALRAIARINQSGLLSPYMTGADRQLFENAAKMAEVWETNAPMHFDVRLSANEARARIATYARAQGVSASGALRAIPQNGLRFHALSLRADGSPVRVVNSDEGFALMFGEPKPDLLERDVVSSLRPFPAGLMSDVGMFVANPVYGTEEDQRLFTRNAYHGLVVWSWQQALFAAGLDHQLARNDLPAHVRATLSAARTALWKRIDAQRSMANSELWSWRYEKGRYHVAPFGAGEQDADESNAAQLWSSAYLALRHP